MNSWLRLVIPTLLLGIGVILVGVYEEIRAIDKGLTKMELLEWRIERLEKKHEKQ